jgi:diguanylate cyclase (GGDEF)-like protein
MNKKILMVDDSNSTIELVKTYIDEYDIIGASCGKEMWEVLEECAPELILLDIIMPGEDGFHLANELSRDERYCDIPIIFISAKNTGKDVLEGLKCDVYDYIKKPFDRFELLARINATLKRKELENKLKDQSVKDSLTDCFNRKYFYNQVKQQISYYNRTNTTFSIALLDIDNFKNVNDTYGHLAGDDVITKFASIIKENIRLYDIPIRFGGEEFAILYPGSDKKEAEKAIYKIKNILASSPPVHEKQKIPFTFSCGIVEIIEVADKNNINFESLIKIADERLYRGKNSGKDAAVVI